MKPEEILKLMIQAIVMVPDKVRIERTVDDMGVLFTLYVDPTDMGLVVGRQGSMIHAVRTVIRTIGMKNRERINLKVFDPNPRPPRHEQGTHGSHFGSDEKFI